MGLSQTGQSCVGTASLSASPSSGIVVLHSG